MSMKVLCWNMSGPFRAGPADDQHEAAWHWIAALQPDVALLQETHVPPWAGDRWLDVDGREGRTWFGSRVEAVFQPDHVFSDTATRARRTAFEIDSWPATRVDLSDHAALVLTLDVDLPPVAGEAEWDPDAAYFAERFHKALWLENREFEEQRRLRKAHGGPA